jgi:DNA-binding HxlR family transcriptional regulator
MAHIRPTRERSPRSYGQYCPAAKALDVLGERWTLLIVRDLAMGPKRYTDLRDGLPGIATDLLTARLRTLESAGFVARRELPRPAPAVVYELTDAGRKLEPVILALAQVGLEMLGPPEPSDHLSAERVVWLGIRHSFRADAFPELTETYQLRIDGEPFSVAVASGEADVKPGIAPDAAMTLMTDARTFVALRRGETTADEELAASKLQFEGDRAAFDRFTGAFARKWPQPERDHGEVQSPESVRRRTSPTD